MDVTLACEDNKQFEAHKTMVGSQKRKLCLEEAEQSQAEKIFKLSETMVEMSELKDNVMVGGTGGRNLNFRMTDKKAKSNLLKAASRVHFNIETNQKSKNLRFSAGAFIQVAKPMIKECEAKFKSNSFIFHENIEIRIEEFRDGIELNAKHFDTKIVFFVNGNKVVMHCYNSTQNIKVEGSIYLDFIRRFLEPLFLSNIELMKAKIVEYDKAVITALNAKPGRPIKPRSVKSIRSDINQPFFSCTNCDDAFSTYSKLRRHKITEHSNSIHSLGNSLISIKHSTRNNSLSEEMLLCEDITLIGDSGSDKPTIEYVTE